MNISACRALRRLDVRWTRAGLSVFEPAEFHLNGVRYWPLADMPPFTADVRSRE